MGEQPVLRTPKIRYLTSLFLSYPQDFPARYEARRHEARRDDSSRLVYHFSAYALLCFPFLVLLTMPTNLPNGLGVRYMAEQPRCTKYLHSHALVACLLPPSFPTARQTELHSPQAFALYWSAVFFCGAFYLLWANAVWNNLNEVSRKQRHLK